MFANIKTKNILSRNNCLLKLIRDILTGDLTNATALNSTYFEPSISSIYAGSAGFPSWNLLWSDSVDPNTVNSCILTSPSYDTTRTNYIKLSIGSGAGFLNITTGTSDSSGVLDNEVYIPTVAVSPAANIFNDYVSYKNIFISATNHSLIISNCFATTYFATQEALFVAVDMVTDQTNRFSLEASMKIGYASNNNLQLSCSNFYNPRTDLYAGTTPTVLSAYNINSIYNTIGLSRKPDLQNNMNLVIPIAVNRLSDGWLGENISNVCGLYLSTSTTFTDGELVTIDSTRFIAINPTSNKTPVSTTRYLIKE